MSALPRPGDLVGGKYRVVRLIGEGGMGAVYEAHHEHLGSQVALKFLHPDLQASPALVARFLQEARVSASLKNPHVTQVIDVDQTAAGAAYLVMELLLGESLERRMERQVPLPIGEAVDIALQTLSALEAAHAHGVVHRDLKPDNVWLCPSSGGPFVKLLDFGIAKLKGTDEFKEMNTRPGSVMGTPAYMAPEQAISADQVDARADLYSFGVILFEMLSGTRPVDSDDPREILERLMRGEVRHLTALNPNVPPGLAAVVDRLVSPNPDDRPATAAQVRAELVAHARASGMVWQGDRQSAVPTTIPPADHAPPSFSPRGSAPPTKTKTDSMPAVSELAFAPTAVAAPPRRRRALLWMAVGLLVLSVAGAAVWALENPSLFSTDALPPLPSALPSAEGPLLALDAGVTGSLPAFRVSRPGSPPRPPSPHAPGPLPSPAAPPTASPAPSFPQLSVPPFTLPSGLIPSAFPPYFPQIPGWTVPAAASVTAAPPASAPTSR